jgi:hypothetical protein
MTSRSAPALLAAFAMLILPSITLAADPARDAILSDEAARARAADPGFTGFSAARGEILFRSSWTGGDPRTPSCMSCHTADPRQPGRNAKTGRPIASAAVSTDPKRYTDPAQVAKHFERDCKSVMGRACTPLESGDYITFMMGQ